MDNVAEGTSLKDFELSWLQRSSDAVYMVIENSFSFLHLLVRFNCDW